MDEGMCYADALSAYNNQRPPSEFGWFRDAVGASPVIDDPALQAAVRAREEYERQMSSIFGRFSPAQLQAAGLSPLPSPYGGTPYGGTPFLQSVPPTAPPSTLPSAQASPFPSYRYSPLQGTPNLSQRPTPNTSAQPSAQASPIRRRSSTGSGSGSGSGSRRSRRGSGGGGCCFGGGGTYSPPVSPAFEPGLGTVHEDEDHDMPEPDAHMMYYQIHRGGEVDLGSAQGRNLRLYLNNLIHSTYQNCFIKFRDQSIDHLNYIETSMHMQYPNPEGHQFSRQWLESHVKTFLKNKKSSVRRAAKAQCGSPTRNHRPGQVHDQEWEFAMAEAEVASTGGQTPNTQQRQARAGQTPTHYGSGGKQAWKDKYVSVFKIF